MRRIGIPAIAKASRIDRGHLLRKALRRHVDIGLFAAARDKHARARRGHPDQIGVAVDQHGIVEPECRAHRDDALERIGFLRGDVERNSPPAECPAKNRGRDRPALRSNLRKHFIEDERRRRVRASGRRDIFAPKDPVAGGVMS